MTAASAKPVDGADYGRALLNILEDYTSERERLTLVEKAALNLLEDFVAEKTELERTTRALLNILEDLAVEKHLLEETQSSVIRSEQALRVSLHEKEVLLREVHHRVKNNLQLIASLLSLQGRYLSDPQSRVLLEESEARVHSIALVHETLYQSGDLARIRLDRYLGQLAHHLVESWIGVSGRVELIVDIPPLDVAIDVAIPCGLIVNELITNAFKHAFPDGRRGVVRIFAHPGASGSTVLTVADDGVGLPEALQVHRSGHLGLELVSTLTRQLRGSLELGGGPGATVRITVPVAPAKGAGS